LAGQVETIDDWLRAMTRRETTGESDLRDRLARTREALRIPELAAELRQAEEDERQGRAQLARRTDADAAKRLQSLSETLEREKRRLTHTRLERLAAAEAETRELQRELDTRRDRPAQQQAAARNQGRKDGGETTVKRLRNLADEFENLKDEPLEELGRKLRRLVGPQNLRGRPESGTLIPEEVSRSTLPPAARRLRRLIDETIQREMLLNRDERVPEAYNGLVEKYFKALSDDLKEE
jgi:hypothetical protein